MSDLKKEKKIDGRSKNGGPRPNSGPKPKEDREVVKTLRTLIEEHGQVEVEDEKDGVKVMKPRILILMDVLYEEAKNNKNMVALKEYNDRVLGKAAQPIIGDKDRPVVFQSHKELLAESLTYADNEARGEEDNQ